MAEITSPVKRRAALASLDANAMLPVSSPKLSTTAGPNKPTGRVLSAGTSPVKRLQPPFLSPSVSGRKRAADGDVVMESPVGKKSCLDEDARSRSHSPDVSSVFDSSAGDGDASWATTTTEPDAFERVVPRPRGLTREQAREKAEILRLRLGLASYKLRTGQTTLSLADLQPKPLPPARRVRVQSPQPRDSQPDATSKSVDDGAERPASAASSQNPDPSPPSSSSSSASKPIVSVADMNSVRKHLLGGDAGRLGGTSAQRGGAASGLLSLARGDTSPLSSQET